MSLLNSMHTVWGIVCILYVSVGQYQDGTVLF